MTGNKISFIIPIEDAVKYMKDAATASYSKKGDDVVRMNHEAIDRGVNGVVERTYIRTEITLDTIFWNPFWNINSNTTFFVSSCSKWNCTIFMS